MSAVGICLIALCLYVPSTWGMGQIRARVHLAGTLGSTQTPIRRALVPLLQRRGFAMVAGASTPDVIRIQLQADGRLALQKNALSKIYKIPSGIQDADVRARAIMLFLGLFCDESNAQQVGPSTRKGDDAKKRVDHKVTFVRSGTSTKQVKRARSAKAARGSARTSRRKAMARKFRKRRASARFRKAVSRPPRPRRVPLGAGTGLKAKRVSGGPTARRPSGARASVPEPAPGAGSGQGPGARTSPSAPTKRGATGKPVVRPSQPPAVRPIDRATARPPARRAGPAVQPGRRPVVPRVMTRPIPRARPREPSMKTSDIVKRIAAGRRLLGRDKPPTARAAVDDRAGRPVGQPNARPSQPRRRPTRVALARPLPLAAVRRRPPVARSSGPSEPVARPAVRRSLVVRAALPGLRRAPPRRSMRRPASRRRVALGIGRGVKPRIRPSQSNWWLALDLAGAFSPVGVEGLPVGGSLALAGGWKWIGLKLDVGLLNALARPPFRAWMLRPTLSLEFMPVRLSQFWLSLGAGGGAEIYWGDDNNEGEVRPRLIGKLSITAAWRPLRWFSVFVSAEGIFSPHNLSFKGRFREPLFETGFALLHLSAGLRFSFW